MKENIKKSLVLILILVMVICQNSFLVRAEESMESTDTEQIVSEEYSLNSDVELVIGDEKPIYEGDNIIARVELLPGVESKAYEYCFIGKGQEETKDFELLREFNDINEYIFCAEKTGTYILRVVLRAEDGTLSMQEKTYEVQDKEERKEENVEDKQNLQSAQTGQDSGINDFESGDVEIESVKSLLSIAVSADKSGIQPSGSVVTLTGKASGGSGSGYEYRFTETYNGKVTTVQNYSEKSTYEYTAKGNGTHKFTVAVRDSSGNVTSSVYTVEVKEAALTLAVSADKSGIQPSGSVVTLTGKASGGSGSGYEYRFTETYNGKVTTVQNYSEKSTYEYTAKGNGTHKFTVAVRDSSGNVTSSAYAVEVKEAALIVSLNSDTGGIVSEGAEAVLEAKAFGGSGDYKYCFKEVYAEVTSVVQEYSDNNEYSFVADAERTGVHEFLVEVEDSVGNVASATCSITVNLKPLTLSISSNKSTNEILGTQVMLTALAAAGDGIYEYRFTETYAGVAETKQAYSENNTYSFTTVGIGEHIFTVAVRDSTGRTTSAVYKLTVEPEAGKELFVSVKSNQPTKVQDGTEIVLSASSSGGYGDTQYRFTETYQGNSVTKQAYSQNNTYSFQIAGLGTHKFTIAVKDKEGQTNSTSCLITVYSDDVSYGVDVSAYQGDINWSEVRNDGISFTMIRVLSGKMGALDVDPYFDKNIAGATQNGIAAGVYRYGYAMTPAQAQREAKMAIDAIKNSGYNITYPIAYDVEDWDTQGTLSKDELTQIIKAFRGVVENNGYKFMIYSGKSWLETKIDMNEFADVDIWLARWFNDKTPNHDHGYGGPGTVTLWQYSNEGRVSGIDGYVDMNIGYKSY